MAPINIMPCQKPSSVLFTVVYCSGLILLMKAALLIASGLLPYAEEKGQVTNHTLTWYVPKNTKQMAAAFTSMMWERAG